VIETVYRRIGDILSIDGDYMTAEAATINGHGVASHMEVVQFNTGQFYSPHYDNAPDTDIFLHFVTFQIVLDCSDDLTLGRTLFPHSINPRNNRGDFKKIVPQKYSALFWYNILEDGNVDESSIYSHEVVSTGSQWLAHVSIWDPNLPEAGDPNMPHDRMYAMHDEL
ncbi:hypothetical protein RFI_15336, partial [Reticulomyxa filosa]